MVCLMTCETCKYNGTRNPKCTQCSSEELEQWVMHPGYNHGCLLTGLEFLREANIPNAQELYDKIRFGEYCDQDLMDACDMYNNHTIPDVLWVDYYFNESYNYWMFWWLA